MASTRHFLCYVYKYGTRGNSCNKNAHFFLSPLSLSAVLLRPCGARLKLSGVLLRSYGVQLELDVVLPRLHELCLKRSRVLLRLHVARLGLDGVLLWSSSSELKHR